MLVKYFEFILSFKQDRVLRTIFPTNKQELQSPSSDSIQYYLTTSKSESLKEKCSGESLTQITASTSTHLNQSPSNTCSHKRMEPDSADSDLHYTKDAKDHDKRRRVQDSFNASNADHASIIPDIVPATSNNPISAQNLALFRVVYDDLRNKSTVGWQNAVTSFDAAHAHLDREESFEFLQLCFRQIVGIMLDQQ